MSDLQSCIEKDQRAMQSLPQVLRKGIRISSSVYCCGKRLKRLDTDLRPC